MDQKTALELFEYRDGKLYWRQPSNPKKTPVGSLAGTIHAKGYIHIQYKRKIYKAHRLIYLMFYGYLPNIVDHIDGNTANNHPDNLRSATLSGNAQNAKIRRDNISGFKNVCWHKRLNKWGVSLAVSGKLRHFGYFDDLELAAFVASEVRDKYHGEFARMA